MSEHSINTMIGEDVEVEVFFDYTPAQKQTNYDPPYPSEVILNGVVINTGTGSVDIGSVICGLTIDQLELECLESVESTDDR